MRCAPNISSWIGGRALLLWWRGLAGQHANRCIDIARGHRTALFETCIERTENALGILPLVGPTMQGKVIAPPVYRDSQPFLDLNNIPVQFTAEVDQKSIVRKFENAISVIIRVWGGLRGVDRQWSSGNAMSADAEATVPQPDALRKIFGCVQAAITAASELAVTSTIFAVTTRPISASSA